jgi:hypothetical protein
MNAALRRPGRVVLIVLLLAFAASNLATLFWYGAASLDWVGTVTELPQWTSARVAAQYESLKGSLPPGSVIISDASNEIVARFEGATMTGKPLLFWVPMGGPYDFGASYNIGDRWSILLGNGAFRRALTDEIREHNIPYYTHGAMNGDSWKGRPFFDEFSFDPRLQDAALNPSRTFLLESFNENLFNNWTKPGEYTDKVELRPYNSVNNFLVYVPSQRADYNQIPINGMLWRFEPDPFDPAKNMEAIGRYLLFNLMNPASRFRVELDYTSTLQADGKNDIPPISIVGADRIRFPVVGHGAARLFSPLVSPQYVGGLPFIELDMGRDGKPFPKRRLGLMNLYGRDYLLDYRRVVGFVRDISIVPDDAYRSLQAPRALSNFPKDLENPNLEFSGLYEDGWMADHAKIWLAAPKRPYCTFGLKALVPREAAARTARLRVTIDGRAIAFEQLQRGDMVIRVPVPGDGRRHEVDVSVTRLFHLPGGDGRPASVLLRFLGYEQL